MSDAWEWELADGTKIIARLEPGSCTESIWLGPRLVSRSGANGKPGGHLIALPPPKPPAPGDVYRSASTSGEATVAFDPVARRFSCVVDGKTLTPTAEPASVAAPPSSARRRFAEMPSAAYANGRWPRWPFAIAGGALALMALRTGVPAYARYSERSKIASAPAKTELTATVTSSEGAIAAHFPDDFVSTVEPYGDAIQLRRASKAEMVVLASSSSPTANNVREIDRTLMDHIASSRELAGAKLVDRRTEDAICVGHPGVSSSAVAMKDGIAIKVSTCTMMRAGRAYVFAYVLPAFMVQAEEPALQKIVDATDIYDLPAPLASLGVDPEDEPNPAALLFASAPTPRARPPRPPRAPRVARPPRPTTFIVAPPAGTRPHPSRLGPEGPPHVHGVSKAADEARDRRMRDYRERVPW